MVPHHMVPVLVPVVCVDDVSVPLFSPCMIASFGPIPASYHKIIIGTGVLTVEYHCHKRALDIDLY